MNTVRKLLEFNYEEIKDALDRTYNSIEHFQRNRENSSLEAEMKNNIMKTVKILEIFKPHIPIYKQKYFDILENHNELSMAPRDMIMTFDRMVYELHSRLGKNLSNSTELQAWSPLMMEILDGRRTISNISEHTSNNVNHEFITSGLTVVNGYIKSRCKIIKSNSDLQSIKQGDIVISRMTTPDIIVVFDKIAGIATEQGGQLCHAAVIAREFNIPCIVGCGKFISTLTDEENLILDANNGVVYRELILQFREEGKLDG